MKSDKQITGDTIASSSKPKIEVTGQYCISYFHIYVSAQPKAVNKFEIHHQGHVVNTLKHLCQSELFRNYIVSSSWLS